MIPLRRGNRPRPPAAARRCLRRPRRRAGLPAGALAVLLALAPPAAGAAQEGGDPVPLSKADVVRLLTGGTYTQADVVRLVRRSCLSFRPTARDRADFRDLGAAPSVMAAVEDCVRRPPLLRVTASASPLSAAVGDTVTVVLTARRAGRPAAGVRLALRGAGGPAGAGAPTATTDAAGVARLRVPAGLRPGTRELAVATPGERQEGRVRVTVTATPGAPAEVRFWPDTLLLERGGDEVGRVVAAVSDRFGNVVPAAPVVVRAGPSPAGEIVADAVADEAGQAVLRIPAPPPGGEEELVVWASGRRLGRLPLRLEDPPALRVAFVEGAGQTAPAGGRLADPLVLEVTTASGEPVPGRRVLFGSGSGSVFPATGRTDSAGRAEVVVWTAADGSPTRVSARVGTQRAEVTVSGAREITAADAAEPGGAGDAAPSRAPAPDAGAEAVAERLAAARREPGDAAAWTELGRAWTAAGRPLDARLALLRARGLASGAARDSVDAALARVDGLPPGLRLSALGGGTFGRDGAAGLRFAEARLRPAAFLEVWGRYDRSLPRRVPALVRGSDPLDAFWGGAEVEWGPSARWTTLLEAGRREYPELDLAQNVYRVEQGLRLPTALGSVQLHGGGLVGRWFDRDDWMAWARAAVPVSLAVDLTPSVWVGETVGTELAAAGREPAREVRGYLGARIRPAPGWRVVPSLGLGSVSSDPEEAGSTLWEGELAVTVDVASGAGLELLVRHQAPPAGDPFTVVAGGLRLGVR